ncbi:T1SS-143 repeat domain-containing protein [Motilimonas pumila]|uniref:Ig-like domain-containing protein n=1 Tax=Motilimonas pumila TaxID=2303987 RepID=A0A418YFC5_9GAMM|nr:hypothetical protein [Motilimonas pumila]RJG47967.1 hypothetical protein D1Z90_09650 [Motilimonas pumila]
MSLCRTENYLINNADINYDTLSFQVYADTGYWDINAANLTALSDGELTVISTVYDAIGKGITATTTTIKDTLASITLEVGDDETSFGINEQDSYLTLLHGDVDFVENGQRVMVNVRDELGVSLSFVTTVEQQLWSLREDLSDLADGVLYITSSTVDIAGNPAESTKQVIKDSQAQLTIEVDSGGDGVENRFEIPSVDIYGEAIAIDDGQVVSVLVTDLESTLTFSAIVEAAKWQVDDANLSSLNEGELYFYATVKDLVGNEASARTDVLKDTLAEIDIDTGVINTIEASLSQGEIAGTVDYVEEGQPVSLTLKDGLGTTLQTTTEVIDGQWKVNLDTSVLIDGEITVVASTIDLAGNPAVDTYSLVKDSFASLTINVESGGDGVENRFEVPAVNIFGDATSVEDGQLVSVLVSDSAGQTLNFKASVTNQTWQLNAADLSLLNEGELQFAASVTDLNGNQAFASTQVIKDTLAEISAFVDLDPTDVIDAQQSGLTKLYGDVDFVEDGQEVLITLVDSVGQQLVFSTSVSQQSWSIESDISSLADGNISALIRTADLAGNPAEASTSMIKDGTAIITIQFEQNASDGMLNIFEVDNEFLFGSVNSIEDGQIALITVTDESGKQLEFNAVVESGRWEVATQDFTGLADGVLTATVEATDLAGNPARASSTIIKDTKASININIDSGGDGIINMFESPRTHIYGAVSNIEDGQVVTVKVSDDSQALSFDAVISNGQWQLPNANLTSLTDGQLSLSAEVKDLAGNPASASTDVAKDTLAEISFVIWDGGDGWLNADEEDSVTAVGSVVGVEDGSTVKLVATDSDGKIGAVEATVVAGRFVLTGLDLTGFSDGLFGAVATVTDTAGNIAIATETVRIDSFAAISLNIQTNGDGIINGQEAPNTRLWGNVINVENGEEVDILVTDRNGKQMVFVSKVFAGLFEVPASDLSSLADGPIVAVATTYDRVGNRAVVTSRANKDTQADITIEVESGGDNILNGGEIEQVNIHGSVSDVELGQTVTLVVSDGTTSLTFTTQTTASGYQFDNLDLSEVADGELAFTVSVSDVAGNFADASTQVNKDATASVTIMFEQQTSDGLLNAIEADNEDLSGTATGIKDGQFVTVTVTDSLGVSQVFTTTVNAGEWLISSANLIAFADGVLQAQASVTDQSGNTAIASTQIIKDTQASITVNIETFGDNTLNADEVDNTRVFGNVTNVEDGQTVTLTLLDANGNTFSDTTVVTGGVWSLDNIDMSGIEEGAFKVTAEVEDKAGNLAIAQDDALKDVLAQTTIIIETNGDGRLNAAESANATISGTVTYIEDGQQVNVVVTDSKGQSASGSATVIAGKWQSTGLNLTGFDDGPLTATVTVVDLAGNTATATDTVIKDTLSKLTVSIETNGDNIINAAEAPAVVIFGQTQDVEVGKEVRFTITDGSSTSAQYTATVQADGSWLHPALDLTGYQDTNITVNASVVDLAGNPANASASAVKDVLANISISIEAGADDVINAAESTAVPIQGTVTNVENGQLVTITVSDGVSAPLTFTTTVVGGAWQLPGVDLTGLLDGVSHIMATASVTDVAGNSANASDITSKDTVASITAEIVSGSDDYLNAAEVAALVTIQGNASEIEEGQLVSWTLTDVDGNAISGSVAVTAGSYQVTGIDVAGLADGELTLSVNANDKAGNPATATDTAIKETELNIDIELGSDFKVHEFINGTTDEIRGTTNAEPGQTVALILTDESGATQNYNATVDGGGNWVVAGIDVSRLDTNKVISIVASVSDKAGNLASDETPDIYQPNIVSFLESNFNFGSQSSSISLNVDNADLTLSDSQDALQDISSEGQATSVYVAADGMQLEIRRDGDGKLVMSALLDPVSSTVKVTLFKPVDQALGEADSFAFIHVEALQNDADGTSELVNVTVAVNIRDVPPDAQDDQANAVEATVAMGLLLDNDSAIDGEPLLQSVTFNGVTQEVTLASPASFVTDKGVLTVTVFGEWTLDVARNLDHRNGAIPQLEFSYAIVDTDGDTDAANVVISITDGEAGSMVSTNTESVEPTVSVPDSNTKTFMIDAGSDDLAPDSAHFSFASIAGLSGVEASSNGEAIAYEFSSDNKTIIGKTLSGEVFRFDIAATDSAGSLQASVTFTQYLPLDHDLLETLTFPLSIAAEDKDGTPIETGELSWAVRDGMDPSATNPGIAFLDEAELASGPVVDTGTIAVNPGSDNVAQAWFDPSKQPEITAGAAPVNYAVVGDVLIAYLGSDVNDADKHVFTVELLGSLNPQASSDLSYEVTLLRAIDQVDSIKASQDPIALPMVVSIQDGDLDTIDSTFIISIKDSPAPFINTEDMVVTEVPESVSPDVPAGLSNTDNAKVNITASQDPIMALDLDVTSGSQVQLTDGSYLTHNGEAVNWFVGAGGLYSGVTLSGDTIFTLELPPSTIVSPGETQQVTMTFSLEQAVDHLPVSNDQKLDISLPLIVTDSDGSTAAAQANLEIWDGLRPIIRVTENIVLDENVVEQEGKDKDQVDITINAGSDDVVEIRPVLAGAIIPGITSGGAAVKFNGSANDDGWWVAKADGNEVFRIRFNLDGTIDAQLRGPLDHDKAEGNDDTLLLNLDIEALDADGDIDLAPSFASEVTIAFKDDAPTMGLNDIILYEGQSKSLDLEIDKHVGEDGGAINRVIVDSVTYAPGDTITLIDNDGVSYATLVVSADGQVQLESVITERPGFAINKIVEYVIQDNDGDERSSFLDILVADEKGQIILTTTETGEDQPLLLDLKVTVGDKDNDEEVTEIRFDQASLKGGTLTFNGSPLVAYDPATDELILLASQIEESPLGSGVYVPKGDLVFTPLLNSSDYSQSITLGISADIKNGLDLTQNYDITVNSIADVPVWDDAVSVYSYDLQEDGGATQVTLKADLFDASIDDDSEVLSYQISDIEAGLELTLNGTAIADGDIISASEADLLTVKFDGTVEESLAGQLRFVISPISTEKDNADTAQLLPPKEVTFNVKPVADTPELTVKDVRGLEDEVIILNDVVSGKLTDIDGSESLSFQFTVPDDWQVVSVDGGLVTSLGSGVFVVSNDDLSAGKVGLLPKEDISSVSGQFKIRVKALATESTQDGIAPDPASAVAESVEKEFEVLLKGVVDDPTVIAGGDWTFDDDSQTITNTKVWFEDELIQLNVQLSTEDDDGSESINILLSGVPEGFSLTDSSGDPASVKVAHIDEVTGLPVYQVTQAEISALYLKPKQDFSGQVNLKLEIVVTEPDGDSEPDGDPNGETNDSEFLLDLNINITPAVDTNDSNSDLYAEGIEDRLINLSILPNIGADIDGSETVTAFSIDNMPAGMTLYLDGSPISVPVDLATLLDVTSPTLTELLTSQRLAVTAQEDASGNFTFDVSYTITDTSETGETVTASYADNVVIAVSAQVEDLVSPENETIEDITRLVADATVRVSDDGSPINLSGMVGFNDMDNDGSEYLDYIIIQAPNAADWYISHPNEAIHDGNGRWYIPATGLTSDSVMESLADILANATVVSSKATDSPSSLIINARVIDGEDAEMIVTNIQVHFTQDKADSDASDIDDLQTVPCIDGQEDSPVAAGADLNPNVKGDDNDVVSFRVLAKDLPHGAVLSGPGIKADYDDSGKVVVQYLFLEKDIPGLVVTNIDPDFAGKMTVPITAIATDSDSGDTLTEFQTLTLAIAPVVDGVIVSSDKTEIIEDTPTYLDLSFTFADSNIPGEGIESVTDMFLVLNDGGHILALPSVATKVSSSPDTWQVHDFDKIDQIAYLPPRNYSGPINIDIQTQVTDVAQGCDGGDVTDSGQTNSTLTFDVLPVTDHANISDVEARGDEDTYIPLTPVVDFVDDDGSETMSIVIKGVPAGALVASDNGDGSYTEVPNNGLDGGSFEGKGTFRWSVEQADLANIVIKPPLDFSGDIPMSIEVITYEKGTTDFVTTSGDFVLEVLPEGDDTQIFSAPDALTGAEGDITFVELKGESLETNSNELLRLTVTVNFDASDATAFDGLVGIRVGSQEAGFFISGKQATATLLLETTEVDGFELITGDSAFGHFDLTVGLGTKDEAIVGGKLESDLGDPSLHNMTLDLVPVLDEPELTAFANNIVITENTSVPLKLDLSLVNPDPVNEQGYIYITGAPAGVTFDKGSVDGEQWKVMLDDVDGIMMTGAVSAQDFTLGIIPVAELNGDQAVGEEQFIEVSVVADTGVINGSADNDIINAGAGDDVITSGGGQNAFIFNLTDAGSALTPAADVINQFSVGQDSIDLTQLLIGQAASTGTELDVLIDLQENAGSTTIEIKPAGTDITQTIELTDISLEALYGESIGSATEADILQRLLTDETIITGQGS